jgi:uncharacterized protein
MPTILITGGTGLVGSALTTYLLREGYTVIVAGRKANRNLGTARYVQWNVERGLLPTEAIANTDYIINLAGAGVMEQPWTPAYKQQIADSRTQSGDLIVKVLSEIPNRVQAVISASAIGWYGSDKVPPAPFTEDMPAAPGFLGDTCYDWELHIDPVSSLGKRLVKLRIGIVLSNDGGALVEFKKPLRFGISGILGSGKQVISWIHIEDLCRMFHFAITNPACEGVYNAVAPQPIAAKPFMRALAKAMGKPFIPLPVPSFALRLMLGERSIEILKSTTVSCDKIMSAGFQFTYPDCASALAALQTR